MLDVTTIILTYNEELHIRRCLENVCQFSKKVLVIDSPSTDRTAEIVSEVSEEQKAKGGPDVEMIVHKYPGNQAEQFNWVLDNCEISTEWILRIDADEYLLPELVAELESKVPSLSEDIKGIEFKRRHIFMGKWVKHGIYPVIILRMFRTGYGRYDARLMDEHIALKEGHSTVFDHDFCDHSLISITEFCHKHLNYAQREACEILDETYALSSHIDNTLTLGTQAEEKHKAKSRYNRMPLFWRSFAYFCYRYILRGGFLDGKEGFCWDFFQGWWYRTLVDAKILEVRKWLKSEGYDRKHLSDEGKSALKGYIRQNWNINL